jgi:hypothetical protein
MERGLQTVKSRAQPHISLPSRIDSSDGCGYKQPSMSVFRPLLALLVLAACLPLVQCTSSQVSLDYEPHPGQMLPGPPTFGVGPFQNGRGEASNLLGTVRTPLGTPIERVYTSVPVESMVSNAFGHALGARGMLATSNPRHIVSGEVMDLHCQQIVHPHGYARLRVNVTNATTGQIIFSKVYEGQRQSRAYRPGSGNPVPLLTNLTSRALQDAVDRALDDPEFRNRTGSVPGGY